MDDNDICYECQGDGNDYYMNGNDELVCACHDCYIEKRRMDDE